jgi:NAD(P)H-dependent FMN reductase
VKPIVVISGTNRAASRSLQLARHVEEIYRDLGAETRLLDLAELPGDIFHPGIYGDKPESFRPWTEAVTSSGGLAVIVPEYNGSFPGILKYFIDLLPFPESFEGRPVSFIGLASGGWGALRAVEHLQGVFGYRNAHIFPKRVFLPQVGTNFQEDGSLIPDLEKRLRQQAEGFVHYVQRFTS